MIFFGQPSLQHAIRNSWRTITPSAVETDRVHHERVALPMADRIPAITSGANFAVLRVQADFLHEGRGCSMQPRNTELCEGFRGWPGGQRLEIVSLRAL